MPFDPPGDPETTPFGTVTVDESRMWGPASAATDGRTPEFRSNSTHIQWRYTSPPGEAWANLIALADIGGSGGSGIVGQYDMPVPVIGSVGGAWQGHPVWSDSGPTIRETTTEGDVVTPGWAAQDSNGFVIPFEGIAPLSPIGLWGNGFTALLTGTLLGTVSDEDGPTDPELPILTVPEWARPGGDWTLDGCAAFRVRWAYQDEDEPYAWHIVRTDENVVGLLNADGELTIPGGWPDPPPDGATSILLDLGVVAWYAWGSVSRSMPVGWAHRSKLQTADSTTSYLDADAGTVLCAPGCETLVADLRNRVCHEGQMIRVVTGADPVTLTATDPEAETAGSFVDYDGVAKETRVLPAVSIIDLQVLDGTWRVVDDTKAWLPAGGLGVVDPATQRAAILEACAQTGVPEELAETVADQVEFIELDPILGPADAIGNAAHLVAHSISGATLLGMTLYTLSTGLRVGAEMPPAPSDATKAFWNRRPGNLRAFAKFDRYLDGFLNGLYTNGVGSADPVQIRSFHTYHVDENDPESPLLPFEPAKIINGAVQSIGETALLGPGFAFEGIGPGDTGLIGWGFDGYINPDAGALTAYIPTNVAISDAVGNAYLMGVVLGKFVGDSNTTDPGAPVSARMRLIRDDLTAPHTIASVALSRIPEPGDYFWFTWNADNEFGGWMNGELMVSVTDTNHPVSGLDRTGMPVHQGNPTVDWEPCYYARVAWWGISDGDPITGDLGLHQWTEDGGWRPAVHQTKGAPALDAVAGLVAGLATWESGPITGREGSIRVEDNGALELPTMTASDDGTALWIYVAANGATIDSVFYQGDGLVSDYPLVPRHAVQVRYRGLSSEPYWEVVVDTAAMTTQVIDELAGVGEGLATLDADGKLPSAQLPTSAMQYQGFWNASTNSPALADGAGDPGDVYRVTVAGTQNLGSGSQTFLIGDQLICNSLLIWEKTPSAGDVDTVFSRTGAVVAEDGDYTASQVVVNPSGLAVITGAGTRVQSALAELDAAVDARVSKALVDAKGDLLVGSASDAVARVAVGTDGTVLVADTNSTAGVIWASPNRTHNYASGQYTAAAITLGTTTAVNNRIVYQVINVYRRMPFDRIAVNHSSGISSAGSVCRLGIYLPTGDGLPGAKVLEAATPVDLTTAAAFKPATISVTLDPGQYLLAALAQFTGTAPVFSLGNPTVITPSADNVVGCKIESGVSGALPSTATPAAGSSGGANIWLRAT